MPGAARRAFICHFVTLILTLAFFLLEVTTPTVAVPGFFAVTVPSWDTVATFFLVDFHLSAVWALSGVRVALS